MRTTAMRVRKWAGLVLLGSMAMPAAGQAPRIGASQADNEFHRITAEDMAVIREKRVLFGSRSFGQNMLRGAERLARRDAVYALPMRRNIINLVRDPLDRMPADALDAPRVLHYLCAPHPPRRRLEEFDHYLRNAPYRFAERADAAMLDYSTVDPGVFAAYAQTMDTLQGDFPTIRFIAVTGGLYPTGGEHGERSWAFSDLVVERYEGRMPILDWRDLLSTRPDGTSAGRRMVPAFNSRPAGNPDGVHPNDAFIEQRLGRALLVMLWHLFCEPGLIANAGFDRTVAAEDGVARVDLDGSASRHLAPYVPGAPPGTPHRIVRYEWRHAEGAVDPVVTDRPQVGIALPQGEHTLTLTVWNDATPPASDTDTVTIRVEPAP